VKTKVENNLKDIKKEISRRLDYYVDDYAIDIKVICNIQLTIVKPNDRTTIDIKIP
jgi:hypothetical protein